MAHGHIVLAQVRQLIPRAPIEAWDTVHGTRRPRRVLSRWSPFGALAFAQLAGRHCLRDVVGSLVAQANALAPLGLRPPPRSPRAEAHARRPAALYQERLTTLYTRCRTVAPTHRFRCHSSLFALESTIISRGLSLVPWARFRTTTGAMQVHTLLDPAGHLPAFVVVTAGNRRELAVARGLHGPVGSMVAMDRGDLDDQGLGHRHQEELYVVTRQKVHAQANVMARFAVNRSTGVTADHEVVLSGPQGQAYPARLRQVRDRDAATGQRDVLWTNAFYVAAPTLAAIDQQRWPVERFLKTIQQNLRIKTFLGTSEHAVMTPVWVALITYLILAFLRFKAGLGISFQQMVRLLQMNLFERRNLLALCSLPPPHVGGTQLLWAV
jgi:Domain of unknown function (DUF4372)/Transposase DDE domain